MYIYIYILCPFTTYAGKNVKILGSVEQVRLAKARVDALIKAELDPPVPKKGEAIETVDLGKGRLMRCIVSVSRLINYINVQVMPLALSSVLVEALVSSLRRNTKWCLRLETRSAILLVCSYINVYYAYDLAYSLVVIHI
jgi:hypothetical protein